MRLDAVFIAPAGRLRSFPDICTESSHGAFPFVEDQGAEVVGEICQRQFGFGRARAMILIAPLGTLLCNTLTGRGSGIWSLRVNWAKIGEVYSHQRRDRLTELGRRIGRGLYNEFDRYTGFELGRQTGFSFPEIRLRKPKEPIGGFLFS